MRSWALKALGWSLWLVFSSAAAGVLIWLSWPWAMTAPRDSVGSAQDLTRKFEMLAFHSASGQERFHVMRWRSAIVFRVHGSVPQELTRNLDQDLRELSALTGLELRIMDRGERANVDIHFVPKSKFLDVAALYPPYKPYLSERLQKAMCFVSHEWTVKNVRSRAYIAISIDRPIDQTQSCLLHELTHLVGLGAHSNFLRPSILSLPDDLTELSVNDKILVLTLYDGRIPPGTPKAEAMETATTVIAELVERLKAQGEAALVHRRSAGLNEYPE